MIKQRVLYVGVGGTGLDLGVHLHEAIQREICGPDGRALNRMPTFANLETNQLPDFVQFLLIDFNIDSLNNAVRAMVGGNVTVARSIQPAQNNYPAVATQLRMRESDRVKAWIPDPPAPPHTEPPVKPYTAGAGQYPTVARAALFSAMSNNGYAPAIGNDIQNALKNLAGSQGSLVAYSQSKISDIAIYLGFSLSGGTGAGLFLDVIQILMHELQNTLRGNKVNIIPIVYLPSTFDEVLNPAMKKRAQLNCAQGILDLQNLVASRQGEVPALTKMFTIEYPGSVTIANAQLGLEAPSIPVISVVGKAPGLRHDDLGRAVAQSVVAQLSYDSHIQETKDKQTSNGFAADLINKVGDIGRTHKLGLGTHVLMPMIASALTVPTQRISDVIAKNVLIKGMDEQKKLLESGMSTAEPQSVDKFLNLMGFAKMINVETFALDQGLQFIVRESPKTRADLENTLAKKRAQAGNNLKSTRESVESEVRKMANFNFADAFSRYMASSTGDESSIVNALEVAKKALDRLEYRSTLKEKVAAKTSGGKKKSVFSKVLRQKVSAKEVADALAGLETEHRKQVEEFWWTAWADARPIWSPWIVQGRSFLEKLNRMLSKFNVDVEIDVASLISELERGDSGVVYYIPTEGRELEAQIRLIEEQAIAKVRSKLNISDPGVSALFTRVVADGDGWAKAINLLKTETPLSTVHEAILQPIRSQIQEAVQPRDGSLGAMRVLLELLKLAVGPNGSELEDTRDLIRKIANLVPGFLVPGGSYQECRVLVTYPGDQNSEIENFIKEYMVGDGEFASIVSKAGDQDVNSLEFIPTGQGDSIRVNINMIGQGLLDNPEIKEILRSWIAELHDPMSEGLIWRQRIGYDNVGKIFDAENRDNVVAAVVRGLVRGLVEVVDGTVEHPKRLRILNANKDKASLVDTFVDLEPMGSLSPWPNVINGFEKLILSINQSVDFRADVVEGLNVAGVRATKTNAGFALTKIPDALYSLVELQASELQKIEHDLETPSVFGQEWLRILILAKEFWSTTFNKALDVKISAGQYADIRTAMAMMPRDR